MEEGKSALRLSSNFARLRGIAFAVSLASPAGRFRSLTKHSGEIDGQPSIAEDDARDPSVWTGRALQAESAEWQRLVSLFCIRPLRGADSSWPSWIVVRDERSGDDRLHGLVAVEKRPGRNRPIRAAQAQAGVLT
jgi:hypothetical protein